MVSHPERMRANSSRAGGHVRCFFTAGVLLLRLGLPYKAPGSAWAGSSWW